nr:MAG TPA: hypothetical protein [Caudoviricetes sp.]
MVSALCLMKTGLEPFRNMSGLACMAALAISTACSYADWDISILREGLFVEIRFYTEERQSGQTLDRPERRPKKAPRLGAGWWKFDL